MFKKKIEGPSVEELQEKIERLERVVHQTEAELDNANRIVARQEDKLRQTREEVDLLTSENEKLRTEKDLILEGRFVLPDETIPTRDLVRVLRVELECTHVELRTLKTSVKAAYGLLEPQLHE